MKICFISPFPPEKMGTAEYTLYLMQSIQEVCSDCKIYVLARSRSNQTGTTRLNKNATLFRIWKMNSFGNIVRSVVTIIRTLVALKADVLHIQYHFTREQGGSVGEPFLALIFLAKRIIRNLKVTVSLHDFWLPREAEQRFYEITRSKLIAKIYRFYYAAYVRAFLNLPDLVVIVVQTKESPVTRYVKKYTKRRVCEVPHGLPPVKERNKDFKLRCKGVLGVNGRFTILLFGFIRRTKGYEYVIKAVDKLVTYNPALKDKLRVLVTGLPVPPQEEVEYLRYLKKLVHERGLDRLVTFHTKYLSESEIALFFGAADLTVISYTRRVGPSGVFSFALAYNVPSIITCDERYVTPATSLPAVITNLDVDEIASAILKLMNDKCKLAEQVQMMKKYKDSNTNEKIALLHLNLYRSLRKR